MDQKNGTLASTLRYDVTAGVVVFFVALPLCLGVPLASGAPLMSGLVAGVIGGILVGLISGSHTSVSGSSPSLTMVIAAQMLILGSFEAFLLAVVVAGVIQLVMGIARMGFLASFFPTSVIKGLLAAIGIILILKQLPHVLGHDSDPEGDFSFIQPDHENTFSELLRTVGDIHLGAAVIGVGSVLLLIFWDQIKWLKKSPLPAPLLVVLLGGGLSVLFSRWGGPWQIQSSHLVQVPVASGIVDFYGLLNHPDFSQWANPAVYKAAFTIAGITTLETLLNLEAVDKIDPYRRTSPPSRELIAQGVGNIFNGMMGGIPITSVIVRSSVNITSGGRTKLATLIHGSLLLISIMFFPKLLNIIPLSCLAAILLTTGIRLASPMVARQMWQQGKTQFIPFLVTIVAIVLTDLLVGVLIGLAVSIGFILNSNVKRPLRRALEKHLGGDVLHIMLANQVSFLNRASLSNVLDGIPKGGQVLLDATNTDYIDPDLLDLIRDFRDKTAPARKITVSLLGFRQKYQLVDQIQYVDHSTRELQSSITPEQVLQILKDGHERFRTGRRLTRDLARQVSATADGQHPLAVVLSCIDSRTPTELVFDLGVGDTFSIRVAGNVTSPKVLASMEYGCAVAGAKLVLVMGHTRCGAVTAAVNLMNESRSSAEVTGCQHIDSILGDIQLSADADRFRVVSKSDDAEKQKYVDEVARRNVMRVVQSIQDESETMRRLVREGKIAIVGAIYDVCSGSIDFLRESERERRQLIAAE